MRIRAFEFIAFGPFTDRVLELQGNGPHLVYGPNEAGKSSALRAINAFFFGIPLRTEDDFIHGKPSLRVGMRLESGRGEVHHLHRLKRRKDTLVRAADASVVPEAVLSRLLGGLSDELFHSLYGLDHAGLEHGAADLLQGRGELGSALFAAGAGLLHLYQAQQEIERKAGALYKPSGRGNLLIMKQKNEHAALRKKIREVQASSTEWESHVLAREQAEGEKQALDAELQELLKEKNRLERILSALPDIVRRSELLEEQKTLAGVRLLPEDFSARLQEAVTARRISLNQCEQLQRELRALDAELAGLELPQALLDAGETISRLNRDLNRVREQRDEALQLEHSLQRTRERIGELSLSLPRALVGKGVPAVIDRAQEARIGRLIDSGARLLAEQEQTAALLEQQRLEVRNARKELDGLASFADASELLAVLEDATPGLEERLKELEQDNTRRARSLETDVARQSLWQGSTEALAALPLPEESSVERFLVAFQECAASQKQLEQELRRIQAELAQYEADMAALERGESIPSEEELARKRRSRELGWELVRDAWKRKIPAKEAGRAYVAKFPEAGDLAQAYAQAVSEADGMADRLRREAERVAAHAALQNNLRTAQEAQDAVRERQDALEREHARLVDAWRTCWEPLGVVPLSAQEMRAWGARMADLSRQARELEQGRARAGELRRELDAQRGAVVRRLVEIGFPEPEARTSFAALLGFGRRKVADIQKLEQKRESLEKQLRTVEGKYARQQEQARLTAQKQADWRATWGEAVTGLGLHADSYPEEARNVLELLRELHGLQQRQAQEQSRVGALRAFLNAFAAECRELAARIAPELLPGEASGGVSPELDTALEELDARLTRARQAKALRQEAQKRREKARTGLKNAEQKQSLAETELNALCALAGCAEPDALAEAVERSERLRRCRVDLEEAEERLRRQSMGLALDVFVEQALAQDAALLAPDLELLEARVRELNERRSELDRTIGSEQAALARMRGADEAARLADAAESLLAGLAESVESYVSLLLAQKLLRQAMERYRETVQGGIVNLAGEYFSRMTLGAFSGVRVEHLGNGDMLVGVREHTPLGLTVEAMSSGSRDQLFLALRLASLSALLDEREPMPVILDDILVNFDDLRAAATLRLLRDLSQRTQIIYFTHHKHLLGLAEGWQTHSLEG